jgi:hypothetical protein
VLAQHLHQRVLGVDDEMIGERLFGELLVSRPGSRMVGKVWNVSDDELRLIVLSRVIAITLETAARTLVRQLRTPQLGAWRASASASCRCSCARY